MNGKNRQDIQPGLRVNITQKHDQRTGKHTGGIVKDILTTSAFPLPRYQSPADNWGSGTRARDCEGSSWACWGGARMNQPEITAYLAASHIAVVATINRHGYPHLTPNWYRYDGKVLTLITRKDRLKYLNLQRANHISVCIYAPPAASNYVVISGTATCNDQD